MNSSIVSLPPEFILNFYYYYSYFTLFSTILLSPLLMYIILTQSKTLKTFKWFILNHAIWCFALEMLIGAVKPLVLTPAPCGHPLGLLRNDGNPLISGIGTVFGFGLFANCIISVLATTANRYLLVFPSKFTNFLNTKILLYTAATLMILYYTATIMFCVTSVSSDFNEIQKIAAEYDSFFENYPEKSLFFAPIKFVIPVLSYCTGLLGFLGALAAAIMIFFIFVVRSHKVKTLLKLQRSLIISSIIQTMLTLFFLILPLLTSVACIVFQIPHSSTFATLMLSMVLSHTLLEYISLLYFITPYRKFLNDLRKKIFKTKSEVVVAISNNSTFTSSFFDKK